MSEPDPLSPSAETAVRAFLGAAPDKPLSEPARRALEEAAARRAAAPEKPPADEQGGPSGLEPTRFGDWERKGVAVDF